ncbi:acyl-protein synthetase [Nemania diffusa]|nr:acyl-protein synthetase [Nemania diffusa]
MPPTPSLGSPSGTSTESDNTRALQSLLIECAQAWPCRSLFFYPPGNVVDPIQTSYRDLYQNAWQKSALIRQIPQFKEEYPILLHLDDQQDAIVWFWAVLFARGLPVMSTPFSSVKEHRNSHIYNLSTLLKSPICIARAKDVHLFDGANNLHLYTVETLYDTSRLDRVAQLGNREADSVQNAKIHDFYEGGNSLAMLMLTSGSTGNAKAVCLTHHQVLAAIRAKSVTRTVSPGHSFLNWIGLDHVASVVEIHLPSLLLGVDQIHVHASNVVSSPRTFLDLLSRHRVCHTFAPNFFLARLATVEFEETWDLSSLAHIISGGEANDVSVCATVSNLLEKCGAPGNVIVPGFGMTETCAGSIYNLECPSSDIRNHYEFASVGRCIKGVEIRITTASKTDVVKLAAPNEPGNIEVRGEVVFKGYYRNPEANNESFTPDGWFRTGDQGVINDDGNLRLIGRTKDVININGVKFAASDIQGSIDRAVGLLVARVICFPSRGQHTERVTVTYVPIGWPIKDDQVVHIEDLIAQACFASTGSYPVIFMLGKTSIGLLPTSALGKISRSKMTSLFEAGHFTADTRLHELEVKRIRKEKCARYPTEQEKNTTEREKIIIDEISVCLGMSSSDVDAETNIFELGITSMDLIRLKNSLKSRLGVEVPVTTLVKYTSARALAAVLYNSLSPVTAYDPVVVLQSKGTKTPLWLVHPGVGEVLVFVGLARQLRDSERPIYALRARGFEGQEPFYSIEEAVGIYISAIQSHQPQGPYALAGYSYGTMLAFEIAKKLEAPVRFLGSFNLPPHIKIRMRQLSWNLCLLNLGYFTGLTSEEAAHDLEEQGDFQNLSRYDAFRKIWEASDPDRLVELGLSEHDLMQWAHVAYSLQSMAIDYEPSGTVDVMDIFHAVPLKKVARSRHEWINEHLSKWKDFCKTEPVFHEVGGAHYTMLGPDHVNGFLVKLQAALTNRGL